jgi:circadian clock protein KaiC
MLVKSGIKGFDSILFGGFNHESTVIVEGVPGAGKTTFGLEFIYRGIVEMHEPGVVITFEEFPEQLYRDALNYGWDLRKLEDNGYLRVVCTSPEVILNKKIGFLDNLIQEIGAKRLLLDSVTQLSMELSDQGEVRKSVYGVCSGLKRLGLTSVLVKEVDDYNSCQASFEEYIADTVIRLYFEESFNLRRRYVEVLKSRGQDFLSGKHAFRFNNQGLEIITLPVIKKNYFSPQQKVSTGIDGLDNILGGGFQKGTTVLIEGSSGTGKTVLGLQFLLKGVKYNEKGLLVATEESANFIKQYAYSFDIESNIFNNRDIIIMDRVYSRVSLEEVISDLVDRVNSNSIERVTIDFINTFIEFSDNFLILKSRLRDLFNSLNQLGCTTILMLNADQSGTAAPLKGVIQPLVQGEIHLTSSVKRGKRYRSLEVCKMKGQNFVSGIHLTEISKNGMAVYQRLGGI